MAQKKPNTTERGWGMLFPEFVDTTQARVANYGKNGRSTKSFVDEGWWKIVLDSMQRGDFVIIQFGHNDEKTDAPLHTDPATSFRENLKRFVDETRAKGATPILLTPIVRRDFDARENLVDTHGDFPQATRETAKELHVPLIDMELKTRLLESIAGWEGTHEIHQFEPPGEIDNTHLCNFGAYVVARLVAEGIQKQNIGIPLNSAPDSLAGASDNTLDLASNYFNNQVQSARKVLANLSSASGAKDFSAAIDSAQNNESSFKSLEEIDQALGRLRRAERTCRWTQSAPFDATFAVGNASFEEGAGWNSVVSAVVPLAWNLNVKLVNGKMEPKNTNASDGFYSYAIKADAGSSIDFYQNVTLSAGEYKLTVDLKQESDSSPKLYVKAGDKTSETTATGTPDSWGTTSVKFLVPTDGMNVRLGVTASAGLEIDNFKLTKKK